MFAEKLRDLKRYRANLDWDEKIQIYNAAKAEAKIKRKELSQVGGVDPSQPCWPLLCIEKVLFSPSLRVMCLFSFIIFDAIAPEFSCAIQSM